MENAKKTTAKATEKPEKKSINVELDDKQLDAVSGGCIPIPNIPDLRDLIRNPKLDGGTQ